MAGILSATPPQFPARFARAQRPHRIAQERLAVVNDVVRHDGISVSKL
jgi:hypothetical protein